MIGNLFVSIPLAIVTYYLARFGINQFKKYRIEKVKIKKHTRYKLRRVNKGKLEIVAAANPAINTPFRK